MATTWHCPACGAVAHLADDNSPLNCPVCTYQIRLADSPAATLTLPLPPVADPTVDEEAVPTALLATPNLDDLAPPGYVLVKELGRGGMGVVYLARQLRLGRLCALKVLLGGGHAGDSERQRFETEAQAGARLQHENIVRVYEIGEHRGQPFLALELCEGGSLAQRLRDQQPTPREAAALIRTLALGMQAAHEARVLHRDLKPSNVLLTAEGTPKVTDFGLAKKLDEGGQTVTGMVLGTPSYMPPEQASGKKDLTPAVDVYALGAILYECLTGRPPFKAATTLETIFQVLENDPVAVRQLNPGVPVDLETIVHKCLRKNRAKRYASARELADDLGRYLEGYPIQARPVAALERGVRWVKRNPVVSGLLGACASAVLGLLVLALLWARSEGERAEGETRRAQEALAAQGREEGLRLRAEAGERDAGEKRTLAERRADDLRRAAYDSRLQLVGTLRDGEPTRAAELLLDPAACPLPARDFAWNLLARQTARDRLTLLAHAHWVTRVALHPSGRTLVTAGDAGPGVGGRAPGEVKVWSLPDGRLRARLPGHEGGRVHAVTFSPDGRWLVSAGVDGTVQFWDGETFERRKILKAPGAVTAVAFSPNSRLALWAGRGAVGVTVWDLAEGKETSRLPTGPVLSLAVSPDGRFAAAGSMGQPAPRGGVSRPIEVWNLATSKRTTVCAGHEDPATWLAFSPDGGTIASVGSSGLRLWDAATGQLRRETTTKLSGACAVAWSPDGITLVVAGIDLTLLDAATLRQQSVLKAHAAATYAVCFSADGRTLATGGGDGTARLWEADTLTARPVVPDAVIRGAVPILHTPDLSVVVCRRPDGKLAAWDAATGRLRDLAVQGGAVLALSSEGHYLASAPATAPAGANGRLPVQIIDLATLQVRHTLATPHSAGVELAFRPGHPVLASADRAQVVLWDVESGEQLTDHAITVQHQQPARLRFSPDGQKVVAGDKIYAVDGWRPLAPLVGNDYAFASGGRYLGVKDRVRGAVDLIDLDTGRVREVARDQGNTSAVPAVSPDGRLLVVCAPDRRVRVFDLAGGAAWSLQGLEAVVPIVAFSPDGRTLATAHGGSVQLWDPLTGAELVQLRTGAVSALAFAPDGRRLAATFGLGEKSRLVFWEADPAAAQRRLAAQGVPRQLLISADGTRLTALVGTGSAVVWDRATGERLLTDATPWNWPVLRRAPTGSFETLESEGTVGGLRGPDGGFVQRRRVTRLPLGGPAAVTPDGRFVVVGKGKDRVARVIDLDGGRKEIRLEGATASFTAAAISPDGAWAALGGEDGGVRVWNAATGRLLFARADTRETLRALAFSPDGRTLAGTDDGGVVRLWDAASGAPRSHWKAHEGPARTLAFRADGQILASGGDDRTVRLWGMSGGATPLPRRGLLEGHRGGITALLFADDGTLYSGGADQAVRWWPLP